MGPLRFRIANNALLAHLQILGLLLQKLALFVLLEPMYLLQDLHASLANQENIRKIQEARHVYYAQKELIRKLSVLILQPYALPALSALTQTFSGQINVLIVRQ